MDPAIESHYNTGYERSRLFAARAVETQPSLIGFNGHLIATATKP